MDYEDYLRLMQQAYEGLFDSTGTPGASYGRSSSFSPPTPRPGFIDARETAPCIAPVVTTLPAPFPKAGYRFFDETREWRSKDSQRLRDAIQRESRFAFQVRTPTDHQGFIFPSIS